MLASTTVPTSAVCDSIIDQINALRAGGSPAVLVSLLTLMANNCADGTVTLPHKMRRLCCSNINIEEAFSLVKNNKPRPGNQAKSLAKSSSLNNIARDIGTQLNTSGSFRIDHDRAMAIINKYLTPRDNAVIGLSVIFTSSHCINMTGAERNVDVAAQILSSILIDETSPKHQNRANVFDPRFGFVGVYNGPHKQYDNVTVLVYAQTVTSGPMTPSRAPPPPKVPPPRTPGGRRPAAAPPVSPPSATPATAAGASAGRAEDTHTITKISETTDKLSYTIELCHLTAAELAAAALVKKGSFVVLRHEGREQMWRMPFPLPSISAISAYCQESDSVAGRSSYLMLKIAKELTDVPGGKIAEVVAENAVVPTNPSVPPKVRPQIKLKNSTSDLIEASLGVCSSDVHVNVKLIRTEVARSNVQFEFQFQEPTASGNMKTLKGNQTVRLPFVCSKADITVALEDGTLNIRIHAPKPSPFDPNDEEQPIAHA